jgi:hypothetical protein
MPISTSVRFRIAADDGEPIIRWHEMESCWAAQGDDSRRSFVSKFTSPSVRLGNAWGRRADFACAEYLEERAFAHPTDLFERNQCYRVSYQSITSFSQPVTQP